MGGSGSSERTSPPVLGGGRWWWGCLSWAGGVLPGGPWGPSVTKNKLFNNTYYKLGKYFIGVVRREVSKG